MILVDPLMEYPASMTRGLPSTKWSHMVSDTSEAELHEFAAKLGLKRAWFQGGGPGKAAQEYGKTTMIKRRQYAASDRRQIVMEIKTLTAAKMRRSVDGERVLRKCTVTVARRQKGSS